MPVYLNFMLIPCDVVRGGLVCVSGVINLPLEPLIIMILYVG